MNATNIKHEPEALAVRPAAWIIGGIFVTLLVLLAVSLLLWRGLFPQADSKAHAARVPPAPRLQADPLPDRALYEAQKQVLVDGYAWVDRQQGVARIPVEQAMRALAQPQESPP